MNVLCDLNVMLDLFLNRSPWAADAAGVWQAHKDGLIRASISCAALPTLFYVMRRQANRERAFQAIDECLKALNVVSVHGTTATHARTLAGNDFEDNLQIACAIEAQLDAIVTRDPAGFAQSPVPALTPSELLQRLATPGPTAPQPTTGA